MQTLRSGTAVPVICAAAELSEDGMEMLASAADARAFVERLTATRAWADAIAFLAHALPRRESVWWAYVCARDAAGEPPAAAYSASLEATKKWIAEPSGSNRQAALDAAEVVGIATPAGLAGLAAFLSGETLGPADAPPAPPAEFAAAKAVAGSVNLAAVNPKVGIEARYADLVRRGIEVADRISLWTPGTSPQARG
ncbi:MAG: DUF6931 family protein [Longimicrobiales bacterium]